MDLASPTYRGLFDIKVCAITGSVGKDNNKGYDLFRFKPEIQYT